MNKQYLKAHLVKDAAGNIEFIASDETVDRAGESIPADSWDLGNFIKSPRLLIDHDYRVESIVGVCENVRVEDKQLKFTPKFHEITEVARTVAAMVKEGVLNTVSVGFLRAGDKKGEIRNELMEISLVAVPANPNARMLGVKSMEQLTSFLKEHEAGEEAAAAEEPKAGDVCTMDDGTEGVLVLSDDTGGLVCALKPAAEEEGEEGGEEKEPVEGDECQMPDGSMGVMVTGEDGSLSCQLKPVAEEEAAKAEKKGMTEDVLEAGREMRSTKWKYMDRMYAALGDFCGAYGSDAVKIEDVATLAAELAAKVGEIGALTPDELPGDMMWCGMESVSKTMLALAVKSGRVLSSKNRDMISAQIDSLESVIAALKDLHAATQPQGDEDEEKSTSKNAKVEKTATPTLDITRLYNGLVKHNDAQRVLRAINVATSEALRDYKRGGKNN